MTTTPRNGADEASPIERQVGDGDAGARLDVFLARQPEVGSRSRAKALIVKGAARVDGVHCKPGVTLEVAQTVTFQLLAPEPPAPPPPPPPPLRVLHEDAVLLVIDKPPGIAVHPPEGPRPHRAPNIAQMAVAHCGPLPTIAGADRPGIVHRLDKDTSGVLLVPKTDEAFYFLKSQFKARTIQKEYRAICWGDPRFDSDYVEGNIGVHPRGDRMAVVTEGGKEAVTFYEVLERFGALSSIRCRPKSGRTHQIRVHMASIGHSLVADRTYQPTHKAELPDGAPDPGRQCLHAYSIGLKHPRTHEDVVYEAPLPADMDRLLRWLRGRQPRSA
ncbi:MAG: RluA family pseudouridine synthase [Planctomycetota bacterium]